MAAVPGGHGAATPYLEPGETLLWEGRPDPDVWITRANSIMLLIFPLLAGIGAYAIYSVGDDDPELWVMAIFWFMLVFGVIGLPLSLIGDRRRRRRTFYAVTDRRALIVWDRVGGGRKMMSFDIPDWNILELRRGRGGCAPLMIRRSGHGKYAVERGFEAIRDGEAVLELMRGLYEGRN